MSSRYLQCPMSIVLRGNASTVVPSYLTSSVVLRAQLKYSLSWPPMRMTPSSTDQELWRFLGYSSLRLVVTHPELLRFTQVCAQSNWGNPPKTKLLAWVWENLPWSVGRFGREQETFLDGANNFNSVCARPTGYHHRLQTSIQFYKCYMQCHKKSLPFSLFLICILLENWTGEFT